MADLLFALYSEGTTDDRFLPSIITQTAQKLIAEYSSRVIEIQPVALIHVSKKGRSRDECVLEAARLAACYDILVVHSDADNRTLEETKEQLFEPGRKLVQMQAEAVCKDMLPVIPVRAIEAWMLADYEALRSVLATNKTAQSLGIPVRAKQVEAIARPKEILDEALRRAFADLPKRQRHRQISRDALYDKLAQKVNLDRLSEVPAYQHFVSDLTSTLRSLHFIE